MASYREAEAIMTKAKQDEEKARMASFEKALPQNTLAGNVTKDTVAYLSQWRK